MTDFQVAQEFFSRLRDRGLKVELKTYSGKVVTFPGASIDDFDTHSFEILNMDKIWAGFDFHGDGSFYRISGYTDGFWQDEVDWLKA